MAQMVKNLLAVQEAWVQSLGQEDPLEKGMATHSSVLAWRIPWTEEPGRLQSMGSQRVDTTERLTHTLSLRSRQVSFSSSSAELGGKGRSVAAFPQLKAFISREKNILGSRWCFVPVL